MISMGKIGKTDAGLLESALVLPQTLFIATNGGLSLVRLFWERRLPMDMQADFLEFVMVRR